MVTPLYTLLGVMQYFTFTSYRGNLIPYNEGNLGYSEFAIVQNVLTYINKFFPVQFKELQASLEYSNGLLSIYNFILHMLETFNRCTDVVPKAYFFVFLGPSNHVGLRNNIQVA